MALAHLDFYNHWSQGVAGSAKRKVGSREAASQPAWCKGLAGDITDRAEVADGDLSLRRCAVDQP